jgi:hypothetical protein
MQNIISTVNDTFLNQQRDRKTQGKLRKVNKFAIGI